MSNVLSIGSFNKKVVCFMEENLIMQFMKNNLSKSNLKNAILETNEKALECGLQLSGGDVEMLVDASRDSLNETERIEINSNSATVKIIEKFMQSTYINQKDYADTIAGLLEVFYETKEESNDILTDDELVDIMFDFFENQSGGSLEVLQTRDLDYLCRTVRNKSYNISDD